MPSQKGTRFEKERRIFRYTLADAWKTTISQVDVIRNAILTRLDVCKYKEIEFPMALDSSIFA